MYRRMSRRSYLRRRKVFNRPRTVHRVRHMRWRMPQRCNLSVRNTTLTQKASLHSFRGAFFIVSIRGICVIRPLFLRKIRQPQKSTPYTWFFACTCKSNCMVTTMQQATHAKSCHNLINYYWCPGKLFRHYLHPQCHRHLEQNWLAGAPEMPRCAKSLKGYTF